MPEAHRLEGRDENGKFAKGNKGGPGRKTVVQERRLLSVLQENVSEEDWGAITRKAVEDAKAGDDRARAWLSRYCLPNINDPEKEDGVETLSDLFEVLQGDIDRMTDPATRAGNGGGNGQRAG